ncbi:hypothetical protein OG349_27690 [Streptomyces sp. NBC_01317]|uniref:hypothetical protein n=1 Tax=Streptomyces sp. NBC_01317 TaxID=2903822 RepID=UPI002E0E78ED|nr:hypothetical protein OG349_27690 [Streptomyces sp. NBC_01317]
MTRSLRAPLLLLALTLALASAGCGTEKAGTADDGGKPDASADPTAPTTAPAADRAGLEARARYTQSAIELIRVTDVPGFAVAPQSVGVLGDDGFHSVYVTPQGGTRIELAVERGTLTASTCPGTPVDGTREPVACEKDGSAWYRTSGQLHEYARPEAGHVVRLTARRDTVDRDTLRRAAAAARPANDAELDALLPKNLPTAPVERGDLPPVGDGAPNNSVPEGASG